MNALRIILPFAFGYFLSYFFRSLNAVIAPDLVAEIGLTAGDLGLLTSAYFLAFAPFQLPLGILLDRYGPRRVEAALLLVAALGAAVFATAMSAPGLILGRALIGLGVSACLMAPFKAFRQWFEQDKLPLINGIQMTAGGLGALAATAPVEAALGILEWRGVFLVLAGTAVVAAAAIFLAVRDRDSGPAAGDLAEQVRGIRTIFTSRAFWRLAPLTVASQSAFLAIQGLWSGPWLRDVAGFGREAVAEGLLLIAAAMIAGFLGIGAIAERLSRHGIPSTITALLCMTAFMVTQACLLAGWSGTALPLWILFGFFGTAGIVPYAILPNAFPANLAGRVGTGLNLLVFASAFAVQWGIGAVIDLWPRSTADGFAVAGYRAAFGVVLALQVLALAWYAAAPRLVKVRG